MFPEAAQIICENHYIDDMLASFSSLEKVFRVVEDVKNVHANKASLREADFLILFVLDSSQRFFESPLTK